MECDYATSAPTAATDPPAATVSGLSPVAADGAGRLRLGTVLQVREDACEVITRSGRLRAHYVGAFPSPRTERVSPGNLVALAAAPEGDLVVFRWYDAVVLSWEGDLVRMWEPAHGEVLATPRRARQDRGRGTRAYLSAGLPGAEWWLAGPTIHPAEDADVELDEVGRFCAEHGLLTGPC